jgi:peptidoglycan/LPS O-acetylase OafA/YrhL
MESSREGHEARRASQALTALPALTSIRFFAALWVVLFHLSVGHTPLLGWVEPHSATVARLLEHGFCGVNLFFVLSGFILAHRYPEPLETEAARRRFWQARLARILPVYWLGLVLTAPSAFLSHPSGSYITGAFVAVVCLVQAWIPQLALLWNAPGWSLSAEAFFYAVFPWLTKRLASSSTARIAATIVACGALSQLVPVLTVILGVPGFTDISGGMEARGLVANVVRFNPLLRLPEFVVGMGLGTLHGRGVGAEASTTTYRVVTLAAAGLLLLTCGVFANRIPYPLLHNGLASVASGGLIYGLAGLRGSSKVLSARWLVRLGEASYAMYILHIPLAMIVRVFWERLLGFPGYSLARVFVDVAVVIVASLLVHRFVEEPARARINGFRMPDPLRVTS